jgi:hypothetical protein
LNRADCCGNRINNAKVYVGETLCGIISHPRQGAWLTVKCKATGSYIKIVGQPKQYLHFCGIRAWGYAARREVTRGSRIRFRHRPVRRTVTKRVAKPIAKPAPKPVKKPAPKPVKKPAPKPVKKPAPPKLEVIRWNKFSAKQSTYFKDKRVKASNPVKTTSF